MKSLPKLPAALLLLLAFNFPSSAQAQGTAFTYQGQLMDGGSPANGTNYGMVFYLYATPTGGSSLGNFGIANVTVSNGLFTVPLDFAGTFDGNPRWLEITIQKDGSSFSTLVPRQPITPAPYSIMAGAASNLLGTLPTAQLTGPVPSANLSGIYGNPITLSNAANQVTGSFAGNFAGNGGGLTNVSVNLTGVNAALPPNTTWHITGNRTNGWPNSMTLIENNNTTTNASPALRVLVDGGNTPDGALSVSANVSPNAPNSLLAEFGNANSFVVTITNDGTITAGKFRGAGAMPWQVVSNTALAALPNNGYVLTNNTQQVTVTLPNSPSMGDVVRISGAGAAGWRITQNTGQSIIAEQLPGHIGTAWTAQNSGSPSWSSIAASADGTKLVAAVGIYGQISTSADSGVTWTPRDSNRYWSGVASSADGTKLVAAAGNSVAGQLYTSTDSGVTWTPHDSNREWSAVASSADGTRLVATVNGGQIYTSTDSGATWTPRDSSRQWQGVASSADGTKLVAIEFSGQIYTSIDSGVTWTPRDSGRNWYGVASSADGTKLIAVAVLGLIYTSTDSGLTWTPRGTSQYWRGVASSADGSLLVAVNNNDGYIYTSADSGITWTAQTSAGSRPWYAVASSADGTKLAAAVGIYGTGQIYTSTPISVPTTTLGTGGYLQGSQNSAIELQFLGGGRFLPISHEGIIQAQ